MRKRKRSSLTDLSKLGKQRRYQLRHIAAGLCTLCSREAIPGLQMCEKHTVGRRERMRKQHHAKRRYHGCLSYVAVKSFKKGVYAKLLNLL